MTVENWIRSFERSATYEGNGNERREADKIYGSQQNPQGGGYYNDPQYKNDPNYKHRKKKGFLGDLFDFD